MTTVRYWYHRVSWPVVSSGFRYSYANDALWSDELDELVSYGALGVALTVGL